MPAMRCVTRFAGSISTIRRELLPQRCGQWPHPARARASRPGSRDPRSHVARPLRRPTRRVEVVVLAVISILLFALSSRMFTGLVRRRSYCDAANRTRLSANRPAHGMNSMSSNWGTSGGQAVSSNSGQPASRMAGRGSDAGSARIGSQRFGHQTLQVMPLCRPGICFPFVAKVVRDRRDRRERREAGEAGGRGVAQPEVILKPVDAGLVSDLVVVEY